MYREHGQGVYGLDDRLCGPKLAAEVTQDVFVAYWQQPDRFEPGRGSLRAYLLTLAHNKSVVHIRSENARHTREQRAGTVEMLDAGSDGALIDEERAGSVSQALDGLPAPLGEAIVTVIYGECTYRDASIVLGVPERAGSAHWALNLDGCEG